MTAFLFESFRPTYELQHHGDRKDIRADVVEDEVAVELPIAFSTKFKHYTTLRREKLMIVLVKSKPTISFQVKSDDEAYSQTDSYFFTRCLYSTYGVFRDETATICGHTGRSSSASLSEHKIFSLKSTNPCSPRYLLRKGATCR